MIRKVREKPAVSGKEAQEDTKAAGTAVIQRIIGNELLCNHLHSYTSGQTFLLKKKKRKQENRNLWQEFSSSLFGEKKRLCV